MALALDLSGRRALVTGAGQGVGRGIALGLAEDVAALVVFLAGPQASWITGQTYPLNGGASFGQ